MSDPLDMLTGAQDAIVQLLQQQLPEDQRGMVRHTLKQDQQPPFHLIGDIETENAGSKDDQVEQLTIEVQTIYKGLDRRELLGLMHQVRLATDEQLVTLDGAQFRIGWLHSAASTAASDGVTYAGITTLELYAEPA